ncbi:hypothetical protein TRVA0_029S01266 [Trichomonascus vanleenenianus]|uniref:uncharacterized protein n=1 Tax=Trichomonascus vanleenenianus TaxID=2268995 RepID=UPI003ECA3443
MSASDLEPEKLFPDYSFEEMGLCAHIPPALSDIEDALAENDDNGEPSTSVLETVIKSPPLPGEVGRTLITMKLTEEFKAPKKGRQRLFLAIVTSAQRNPYLPVIRDYEGKKHRFKVVVEVFDPFCFEGINPAAVADSAYARTVKAYELVKDRQGSYIPKFYGSYTMRVPVVHSQCKFREVRVILRQYIDGPGLNEMIPSEVEQKERFRIMYQVVLLERKIDARGVSLGSNYHPNSLIDAKPRKNQVRGNLMVWYFSKARLSHEEPSPSQEDRSTPEVLEDLLAKWKREQAEALGFGDWVDWNWIQWVRRRIPVVKAKKVSSITKEQKEPVGVLDEIEP